MGKYLTRRGNSFVFQLRPPKSFDPGFRPSPIRVRLGPMPARSARRIASVMAASAHLMLAKLAKEGSMSGASDGAAYVTKHLHVLGPLLSGLNAAADVNGPNDGPDRL
jgi:hypothetical protein